MSAQRGRPKAQNPKCCSIKIRFDRELFRRLEEYTKKYGMTRTEVIRRGAKELLDRAGIAQAPVG